MRNAAVVTPFRIAYLHSRKRLSLHLYKDPHGSASTLRCDHRRRHRPSLNNRPLLSRGFSSASRSTSWPSGSVYDPNSPVDKWEDWFTPEEYMSPWDETHIPPLNYPPLENSTRYLMQLLQDVYHGVSQRERATTERCNRIIQKLANPSPLPDNPDYKRPFLQRAVSILRHMELFHQFPTRQRLAFALPFPNSQTYLAVLKLYAQTPDLTAEEGPRRAYDIVDRMQKRYNAESAALDLKPHVVWWNQVLSCWAVCADPEKAFHAYKLLKDLEAASETSMEEPLVDKSSYAQVLRACAFSHMTQVSRRIGGEVAVRVWKRIRKRQVETTPHIYVFYMQSIATLKTSMQRELATRAFLECCEEGKVNSYVLQALRLRVGTQAYSELVDGSMENRGQLPSEWTRNCDSKEGSQE